MTTVAALALAVAACGGGGAATGAGNPTNGSAGATADAGATPSAAAVAGTPQAPAVVAAEMCALLSAADLKTATNLDYGAGVPDEFGSCTWRVGSATVNNGDGQISAAIQDTTLEYIKGSFSGGVDLTVGGHAAYWNVLQDVGSIWVDVNGRLFVLSISPGTPDSQATMVKIAEVAVPKL
jgi:hypothetical protein